MARDVEIEVYTLRHPSAGGKDEIFGPVFGVRCSNKHASGCGFPGCDRLASANVCAIAKCGLDVSGDAAFGEEDGGGRLAHGDVAAGKHELREAAFEIAAT